MGPHQCADILRYSITVGNVVLMEHLFAIGVNANVETSKTHLPLVLAIKTGQSPVVDAILNNALTTLNEPNYEHPITSDCAGVIA